jgi:hypothetical protein
MLATFPGTGGPPQSMTCPGMATPRRPTDLIAPHHPPLELCAPVLCARGKISPFSKTETFALGGLVRGRALYKAVDTADSMFGHKD